MTVSTLKKKLVFQAIEVLRDLNKQYYEESSKKKPLLEDEGKSTLFLQVMLKKIPKSGLTKMIKVNLPHSLLKDTDEVCLITGDLDKRNHKAETEPDVLYYKAILAEHGVTNVSEVITLRQLRTEYKPYEAKQKLLAAFDVFLSDNKITECLPRLLGKHFFKKRKFPIQIDLKTSNLKQQIEKALSTKVFYITGQGNCCASEVAYLDMDDSEILANVMAVAEALSKNVPGSWCNVMGVYLRTARSKAIPLYVSYDNSNDVQLPEEKKEKDFIIDELSTAPKVRVKVYEDGRVETKPIKEDLETSFVETYDTDTEESNFDSKLQGLENFETETTKEVNSEKGPKSAKEKKKSVKQEPVSPDLSPEKVESHERNKKMALKRKRRKSESLMVDSEQSVKNDETPVQATKKRKIEGINLKRYQSMKESRKSNRKKNQQRNKQKK